MLTPEAITHGTTLLIGILIGVAGLAAFRWVREETAFTARFRAALKEKFAEYRTEDGGRPGVVVPVPEAMVNPAWLRQEVRWPGGVVPSWARSSELNEQTVAWPSNAGAPARHRQEHLTEETRSFSRAEVAAALGERS